MSGAHTPGPWHVSPTDWEDCHAGIYSEEANSYLAVIVGTPCSEGDTRLIAAAPELLAALEWAVETADTEQYEADWYAAARVAIAKARGEE